MNNPSSSTQEFPPYPSDRLLAPAELRERLADALAAVAMYKGLIRLSERVSVRRGRPVPVPVAPPREQEGVAS